MKILKKILIGLAGILGLLLIIAIFVPKKFNIERDITINKPVAEVFDYLKHIKNQDKFSKWNMADPNKKQTSQGNDGTVGFKNAWDGNDDVGAGEQEITGITPNQKIDTEIRFKRPMEDTMWGYFKTEAVDANTTKVTWACYGDGTYPFNIMNLLLEGMLGDDMQESLNNLKNNLEK